MKRFLFLTHILSCPSCLSPFESENLCLEISFNEFKLYVFLYSMPSQNLEILDLILASRVYACWTQINSATLKLKKDREMLGCRRRILVVPTVMNLQA